MSEICRTPNHKLALVFLNLSYPHYSQSLMLVMTMVIQDSSIDLTEKLKSKDLYK